MAMGWLRREFKRDPFCAYCRRATIWPAEHPEGWTERDATRDHRTPLALGGSHQHANCALACRTCNQIKNDTPYDQWLLFMRDNPLWWEAQPWKRRKPPMRQFERAASGAKLTTWARDQKICADMEWTWLRELVRVRVWSVSFGPW